MARPWDGLTALLGRYRRPATAARASVLAVLRLCWQASPPLLTLVLVLVAVSSGTTPATLVLIRVLVDAFIAGDAALATAVAVALALLAVVRNASQALLVAKQTELADRVTISAEQRLLDVAARAPLVRYYDSGWYDSLARARDGVQWQPPLALATVMSLFGTIVSLGGMIAIVATLDIRMLLLAILAALPLLVQRRSHTGALYRVRRDNTVLVRQRDYVFDLLLRPELATDVRAYGLVGPFGCQHKAFAERALHKERVVQHRYVGWAALAGAAGAVCFVLAYLLAGSHAAGGEITAGELFLVFTAFAAMTTGITDMFGIFVQLEEHAAYLTDYFQLVDVAEPAVPAALPAAPLASGSRGNGRWGSSEPPQVELRDVWYAYPDGTPALRGLSFIITPGECVALMGRNGAGKSTVVKLILGLLQPDRGAVLLGGRDIRDLGGAVARSLVAVLFQEYGRYEFSVAETVRLGRVEEQLDRSRMWQALDHVGMRSVVDGMPRGAENVVGRQFPGGRDLSGGQWQRMALARVLYRDCPIWVLDEPTAALDAAAEATFLRQLRTWRHRRTLAIVTHRLDTARSADRIVLVRDGTLGEEGTHDELVRSGGEYAAYHVALRSATGATGTSP